MYDDDSEDSKKGAAKLVGNVAKGAAGGAKRVARGTRRMSLMAAGNVKKVGDIMPSNVKKAAAGTVKVGVGAAIGTVGAVGHVARGAEHIVTGKGGKKKKKKKKKHKEPKEPKKSKERGRSESPRRNNNASSVTKPPVTKPKGIKSMFSPKRWRSASPAVGGRKKKNGGDTEEELQQSQVVAAQQQQSMQQRALAFPGAAPNGFGGGGGGYTNGAGGPGFGYEQQQRGGFDPMQSRQYDPNPPGIGGSMQSRSSGQKLQRTQTQELIARENNVPFVSGVMTSSRFVKLCDAVFDMVDSNGDGTVDETELYAGLLLMHLKIGSFLGPAACRPLSRERCDVMFHKFDADDSGCLDQVEFRRVITVLFANVLARVTIQFTLSLFLIPFIAKYLNKMMTLDYDWWWDYWTKPKRFKQIGEELTLDDYVDWRITSYPSSRRAFLSGLYDYFRIGSDDFWEGFSLTFLTIILGFVVAPLVLYAIDDIFHLVADRKNQPKKSGRRRR